MIKLSIERKLITSINIFHSAKKKKNSIHNKCNKIALHYKLYLYTYIYTYIACFTIYKIIQESKVLFFFQNMLDCPQKQ